METGLSREDRGDLSLDWEAGTDVLSTIIRMVEIRGIVLSTMRLGSPWRVQNSLPPVPVLHVVGAGVAYFSSPLLDAPLELHMGDAIMLPTGGIYQITDQPGSADIPPIEVPEQSSGTRCSVRLGGPGAQTELTCCAYAFRTTDASPLLNLLPRVVVVRAASGPGGVEVLLTELVWESKQSRVGTEGVVSRLAELVFLRMLRGNLDAATTSSGLAGALRDPRIGKVLNQIHTSLDAPCTVATLASRVGMSRAAFSELFTTKVGESPIRYLQRCRLREAMRLLIETELSLGEIGEQVGYSAATAFSRAFRREVGCTPRTYRQASRTS